MNSLIKAALNGGTVVLLRLDDVFNCEFRSPLFSQFASFDQLTWHDVKEFGELLNHSGHVLEWCGVSRNPLTEPLMVSYTTTGGHHVCKSAKSIRELEGLVVDHRINELPVNYKKVYFYGYEIPYFD